MGAVLERQATSEQVIRILRKQGDSVKPEYTRCRAKVGGGQCTKEITYNMEGDYWSNFCAEHDDADSAARADGTPRVAKLSESDIEAQLSDEDLSEEDE